MRNNSDQKTPKPRKAPKFFRFRDATAEKWLQIRGMTRLSYVEISDVLADMYLNSPEAKRKSRQVSSMSY